MIKQIYWTIKYRLLDLKYKLRWPKCWYQRAKNGYSYMDVWNLFHYMSNIMIPALEDLKVNGHGFPANQTIEEWNSNLDIMIEGFKAALRISDCDWDSPEELDKLEKIHKTGMRVFGENFLGLWD